MAADLRAKQASFVRSDLSFAQQMSMLRLPLQVRLSFATEQRRSPRPDSSRRGGAENEMNETLARPQNGLRALTTKV